MADVVIRAEGLGKKYVIGHQAERERYVALRDVLANGPKNLWRKTAGMIAGRNAPGSTREEFWALRDVNFDVKRGEVLGIIGRNGAGKSTLLKVLSRITEPSEGRVSIKGRVASLLEVGTGFHPELTGRENIYLNGAILGMTRAEIRRKFDEIVAFAEVEKFLDTPVKRYSSGMYVRLAFAVAAHLEPEILVIDEVLAVGDAEFQKKCLGKMQDVAGHGRTVLFVSHNMGAVRSLTERCAYLEHGKLTLLGNTEDVVARYLGTAGNSEGIIKDIGFYRRNRNPDAAALVREIGIKGAKADGSLPVLEIGEKIQVALKLQVLRALNGAHVSISFKSQGGEIISVVLSLDSGFSLFVPPGEYLVTASFDDLPLSPGKYFVDIGIGANTNTLAYDVILNYPLVEICNHGQITQWLERPWGPLHCRAVDWAVHSQDIRSNAQYGQANEAETGVKARNS